MDQQAAIGLLGDLRTAMHDQFPGNTARLAQLDSHLATIEMVVEHMFDEEARSHG